MKNHLWYTISFSLVIVLWSTSATYGQEYDSEIKTQKKNAIYGQAGYTLLGGGLNASYSRLISQNPDKFFKSYWIGIEYGLATYWADEWRYWNLDCTFLTGANKSHFELAVGLATFKDVWSYKNRQPSTPANYWRSYSLSGSVGYRLQKPDGRFYFRTGIGFPDGIYVGLGVRF